MASENNNPHFGINASLIRRLAEQMIPDEVAALTELVKNAYDAGAQFVRITIQSSGGPNQNNFHFPTGTSGYICVEDDGHGMTEADFTSKWLVLAGGSQAEPEDTGSTSRVRLGGQGFGRLACLRLGEKLELFSTPRKGLHVHAAVSWEAFKQNTPLEDIQVFVESSQPVRSQGTTLFLFPPTSNWAAIDQKDFAQKLQTRVFSLVGRTDLKLSLSIDGVQLLTDEDRHPASSRSVVLENVWASKSPELISEIVSFYEKHQLIRPGFSTEDRARQAVFVVRDQKERNLVGISTTDVVRLKQLNENVFFLFRCIILPNYRHPGLDTKLLVETRDFLEKTVKASGEPGPIGLLTFVENPRLQQTRNEAVWAASKMAFVGYDKKGRHIRVYYFRGATI